MAVALVAKSVGNTFVVEFLRPSELDQEEYERIKLAVTKELNFYLVEKGEKDPWQYAMYHCGTASNIYSDVHWGAAEEWRRRQVRSFLCGVESCPKSSAKRRIEKL